MNRLRGEHVAVAAGLLLAAVAAVTLLTRGDDEEPPATTQAAPASSASSASSRPAPAPSAAVRDGRLVVDGKPFFPIMSWGECTDGFETSLPVGTNLYAANRCGGLEAQLPALGDRALSAAVAGEAIPDPAPSSASSTPTSPTVRG